MDSMDKTDWNRNEIAKPQPTWEAIFQVIGQPVIILDPQYKIIAANIAAVKLTCMPVYEMIGKRCYEVFHSKEADSSPNSCPMRKLLESGQMESSEMEMQLTGGVFLVSCTPVYDSKGKLENIIHVATDLTEVKREHSARIEETFRESEERYKALSEATLEGVVIHEGGKIIDLNSALMNMVNYEPDYESHIGKSVFIALAPESREKVNQMIATESEEPYEIVVIRKNGTSFNAEIQSRNTFYKNRKVRVTAVRDITERKKAERKTAETLAFLQTMIEKSPIGIITYNSKGDFVATNEATAKIVGATVEQLKSQNFRQMESWKNSGLLAAAETALSSGIAQEIEVQVVTSFGKEVNISTRFVPFYYEGEQHLLNLISDITDRMKALEALREQQKFTESLVMNSSVPIFVLDKFHKVMIWNKACEELSGYPASMIVGTDNQWKPFYDRKRPTIADIVIDGNRNELSKYYVKYSESENSKSIKAEGWYEELNNKSRYIVFEATPIYDSKGNLAAAIETIHDITEIKCLEEQLLHSQKLEAIGQLAGGVAHDFNNILSVIIGYAHLTLMEMPPEDPSRANLDQVIEASERASHLTQGLLAFSRKQVMKPHPVELNGLVRDVLKMLKRLMSEDIVIDTIFKTDVLRIYADSSQIEQVIINLATNARDAMPDGGMLKIETDQTIILEDPINSQRYETPQKFGIITITDTGKGMSHETVQRIFEPFYTTKEVGKGTGLGLSIVYGIITQHEGYITVSSEVGNGTVFNIYLPLMKEDDNQSNKESISPLKGGDETILLTEDDPVLRELLKGVLIKYGYHVIIAVDGEDAINVFNENKDRINLLLFDMIMPRKSGMEAYEAIKRIQPDIRILFISGYSADLLQAKNALDNVRGKLIMKPLQPKELARKVREVLDDETI